MTLQGHTATSFRAADPPLRRYVSLLTAFERVLTAARRSGIDGQPLREQLIHTWAFHVVNVLHLEGATVTYGERGKPAAVSSFGSPDVALREATLEATRAGSGVAFRDSGRRLFVDRTIQEASARLVAGLLHTDEWPVPEIGWIGDSVELLHNVLGRSWRRELDRIAHRVTDRQTMLKELRPNSLYYNLLHAIEHVIRHDDSSTLFAYGPADVLIVAETLHHDRPAKSTRIGTRLNARPREVASHVISFMKNENALADDTMRELFGPRWGAPIMSALVLPLHATLEDVELVLVLTDGRPEFFSGADLEAVEYIASRTTPVIVNSVTFSSRISERSRTLDELILRSASTDELLDRAVRWLGKTFDAPAASIHVGPSVYAVGNPGELDRDVVERLGRGGRALFVRNGAGVKMPHAFAAPLRLLDDQLGVVACHYDRLRQPTQFEHFLLEAAAQQISSALSVRTVGDKQLADLRRVLRLMEKVASARDDAELLNLLTVEVKTLLTADYCFVSLPEPGGRVLRQQARTWRDEFDIPPIEVTGRKGEGITGYVAKELTLYRTGDVMTDPYYRPIVDRAMTVRIESEMAGPLVFEGQLIGVIDLLSSRRSAFSEQDETLLRMLLAHSSIALAQTQRARVASERTAIVDHLHLHLLNLTDPNEIYQIIFASAREYVSSLHPGVEIYGNLYVKRPNVRFLEVKAFNGPRGKKFSPTQYFDEGVVGRVAATRAPITIADTGSPPEGIVYEPFIEGIVRGSEIAVPIGVGDEIDAVINLESPERALFGARDLSALEALAHEISLAVRFAQLHEAAKIHRQRTALDEQLRFLRNLSHEVAKSARMTSAAMPEIEPLLNQHPKVLPLIQQVRERAESALKLERRLLASLANTKDALEATADVVECLHAALERVAQYPHVEVIAEMQTESFPVAGSADLITIAFTNLFDNAIEAMQSEGRLTVREHVLQDPAMLVLDISDTGHGIRDELRAKIWEPFFSDDGTGREKGQGVGMAIVRDNLERVQAFIDVFATEVGRGTTFRITFTSRAGK